MHPAISRLLSMPPEMSVAQVSHVLGMSAAFVCRVGRKGIIEARAEIGRGEGANRRYTFTREAVLAYLIATTTGPKLQLLDSIARAMPELHEWARALASGAHPQLPTSRPRRPRLPEWHPDQLALFESPSTTP